MAVKLIHGNPRCAVIDMKDVRLKLMSELMKNSRRSDRELAKAIGVSQPTVSRLLSKLKEEGYVREYTVIPDFRKLGYEIAAFTFVKLKQLTQDELEKARAKAREDMRQAPSEIVLFERGMGAQCDGVIVSFHKNYSSYLSLRDRTKEYSFLESCNSFLINLNDEIHYRQLTFSTLADHILGNGEEKPKQPTRRNSGRHK